MLTFHTIGSRCFFGHFNMTKDKDPLSGRSGVACYLPQKKCLRFFFAKLFKEVITLKISGTVVHLNKRSMVKWLERHDDTYGSLYALKRRIKFILINDFRELRNISLEEIPFLTSAQVKFFNPYFSPQQCKCLSDEQIRDLDVSALPEFTRTKLFGICGEEEFIKRSVPLLSIDQIQKNLEDFAHKAIDAISDDQFRQLELDNLSSKVLYYLFGRRSNFKKIQLLSTVQIKKLLELSQFKRRYHCLPFENLLDDQIRQMDITSLTADQVFENFVLGKQKKIQLLSKEQLKHMLGFFDDLVLGTILFYEISDTQLDELTMMPEFQPYREKIQEEIARRKRRAQ